MIHLTQGQALKEDSRIIVAVPTGDYNETDLIECYEQSGDSDNPTMMFQAQFVAFGGPVYQQSDELTEDQVAAFLANKPASEIINNRKLIDGKRPAAKYVGRVIKKKGSLAKKELRKDTLLNTDADTQQATTTPAAVVSDPETVSTSTPATTTPAILNDTDDTASSTATSTEQFDDTISTSTPDTGDLDTGVGTSTDNSVGSTNTSTPMTDLDTSTTTSTTSPDLFDNVTGTSSTTTDIVAYAKKKIGKKLLGL